MPVDFLKYYQGKLDRIPEWKMDWAFEGGQTLREYLNQYRVTLKYPNSDKTLTTSLAGYCERLDTMQFYHSLEYDVKMKQVLSKKGGNKETVSRPHYTIEQKELALDLRKQGKTWAEIKAETGVPANVVKRYENSLKIEAEVERQPASEQGVASNPVSVSAGRVTVESNPLSRQSPFVLPIPIPAPILVPVPVLIPVPVPVPVPIIFPSPLPAAGRDDSSDEQ
ncbi:hypothetical protein [Kistimonas scapharcae]|uniref:hypothetical protein n=1 Tax=Kistimonas scapharcae TaxID=1036133 RepID=UPI0031E6416A